MENTQFTKSVSKYHFAVPFKNLHISSAFLIETKQSAVPSRTI